jgi:hypothetical protein
MLGVPGANVLEEMAVVDAYGHQVATFQAATFTDACGRLVVSETTPTPLTPNAAGHLSNGRTGRVDAGTNR